jgi:hypothetical protein
MKYLLTFGAVLLLLAVNVTSCKKGDHDPFFSLKTRKARLTGKWVVSRFENISSTSYQNYGSSYVTDSIYSAIYDGTNISIIRTTTTNGVSSTFTSGGIYTEEFEFKKDGTFIQTRTDGGKMISEGNWEFLGKNKTEKLKNKEAILLNYTNYTNIFGESIGTSSQYGINGNSVVYEIDELKSKEIVLINKFGSSTYSSSSSGKITITLKAK